MSDVVVNWLNEEVRLTKRITSETISEDFANGFRFGEVLNKYKCAGSCFDKYTNSDKEEDVKANFDLLSSSLIALGFNFSEEVRRGLTAKDKNAISLFLYKLKGFLDKMSFNFNRIVLNTTRYRMSGKAMVSPLNKSMLISQNALKRESHIIQKNFSLNQDKNRRQYAIGNGERLSQSVNSLNDSHAALKDNSMKPNDLLNGSNAHVVHEETIHSKVSTDLNASKPNKKDHQGEDKDCNNHSSRKADPNYNSIAKIEQIKDKVSNESFHAELFNRQMNRLGLHLNELEMKRLKHKSNEDAQKCAKKLIMSKLNKKFNEKFLIRRERESLQRQMLSIQLGLNTPAVLKTNLSKSVSAPYQHDIRQRYEAKRIEEVKAIKQLERDESFHCQLVRHIMNYKHYPSNEEEAFNQSSYFHVLDIEENSLMKERKTAKDTHRRADYALMSMMFDQIFNFTFEAEIYQTDTKEDYVLIEKWRKWSECFIYGKQFRQPADRDSIQLIKQEIASEEEKAPSHFSLNDECHCQDYLNYLGDWSINPSLLMEKVDFSINEIYSHAYFTSESSYVTFEPTDDEMNNLVLPKESCRNAAFGDLIHSLIESKFPMMNMKDSTYRIGKYSNLPVKLCFIGYPYSGRKTLAKKVQEEYPNIKVYAMNNTLVSLIKEYSRLNSPVEENLKPRKRQTEQMSIDKEKELNLFKEAFDILSPYVKALSFNPEAQPSDELLFKLFKLQLERDFDNDSSPNEREDDMVTALKRKQELQIQLDHLRAENAKSKKPKLKEEESLQREIAKLTTEAYKGFICIDYPRTINQFTKVENYFTGYVPEMHKPKAENSALMEQLSSLIDVTPHPPNKNQYQKGGFDYVVDFNVQPKEVHRRTQGLRYDPVTSVYYHLDDNPPPNDKKVRERLIQAEVVSVNQINQFIEEHDSSRAAIKQFYHCFGNERLQTKAYQVIKADQRQEELYTAFRSTVVHSITKHIEEKEGNEGTRIDTITFKTNDQAKPKKESKITLKKLNIRGITTSPLNHSIRSDHLINQIKDFHAKYQKECLTFTRFVFKQKERITTKVGLIQKFFLLLLSASTRKKEYIDIYINKTTSFLFEHPSHYHSPKVINHFKADISLLSDKIWLLIQRKKQELINEFILIKASPFFHKEKAMLYEHIEWVFISEASKYICFMDIINQYHAKAEGASDTLSSLISPDEIKAFLLKDMPYEKKVASLFKGCFFLIAKIDHCLKELITLSKMNQTTLEASNTKRTKHLSRTVSFNKEGQFLDDLRILMNATKHQFKYRIVILRHFALEHCENITRVADEFIAEIDQMIVRSVQLQNDAMNQLIAAFNEALLKGDIPCLAKIEMDRFQFEVIGASAYFKPKKAIEVNQDKASEGIDDNSFKMFIEDIRRYESIPGFIKSNEFIRLFLLAIERKKAQNGLSKRLKTVTFAQVSNFISRFEQCYLNNKTEYEAYLETNKLLTLLLLCDCVVATKEQIDDMLLLCKEQLINSTCLSRDDFMHLSQWYEDSNKSNGHYKETLFEINKIENEDVIDMNLLCNTLSLAITTQNLKPNKTNQTYFDALFSTQINAHSILSTS